MTEKTEKRRADLRRRIVDAAERALIAGGSQAVKARDLAREADCALGALYTVFDDRTAIILEVNGRTFRRLGDSVIAATSAQDPAASPVARLVTMAKAYAQFADANDAAWRALFEVDFASGVAMPDWYSSELARLFALIAAPLTALYPAKSEAEITVLTRALFSSVHGITLMGSTAMPDWPMGQKNAMIEALLHTLTIDGASAP
ncbi:MAG: TetR/AcrR family transcriptional regulator [Pseudomonadota bacterium]